MYFTFQVQRIVYCISLVSHKTTTWQDLWWFESYLGTFVLQSHQLPPPGSPAEPQLRMFWHLYYDSICGVALLNWSCFHLVVALQPDRRQHAEPRHQHPVHQQPPNRQSSFWSLWRPPRTTWRSMRQRQWRLFKKPALWPQTLLLKKFIQPKPTMVLLYTAIMKSGRHHHLTRCCHCHRQELRMAGIVPNIPVGPIILQDPEVSRSCQLLTMFWDNLTQQEAAVLRTNTLSSSLFPSAASLISEAQEPPLTLSLTGRDWFIEGTVHPQNKKSVTVYAPSCGYKVLSSSLVRTTFVELCSILLNNWGCWRLFFTE